MDKSCFNIRSRKYDSTNFELTNLESTKVKLSRMMKELLCRAHYIDGMQKVLGSYNVVVNIDSQVEDLISRINSISKVVAEELSE